ncbi:hypothetical protein, partial [Klebsiella pneumoniae]|uniref:hypothetical protein n=1 Tax=Klebsiella pneumoniae TaxID=573 RepID=UPI0040451E4E
IAGMGERFAQLDIDYLWHYLRLSTVYAIQQKRCIKHQQRETGPTRLRLMIQRGHITYFLK